MCLQQRSRKNVSPHISESRAGASFAALPTLNRRSAATFWQPWFLRLHNLTTFPYSFRSFVKKAAGASGQSVNKSGTCGVHLIVFHNARLNLIAKITYWFPQFISCKYSSPLLLFLMWSSPTTHFHVRSACNSCGPRPILRVALPEHDVDYSTSWQLDAK